MPNIHPTALVDPSCEIESSVTIGPYCVLGPNVRLGRGTVLHNHVIIPELTTLGEDNEVYPCAVIGADPQDRKFRGERSQCFIGDRNQIREHVTIHRGTGNGGGVTRIGNENLIMVAAHIAHDCQVASHTTIANQVMLAGHVHVEEGASLGGGAGVHHFATVGACCFVGAMARIAKDVPPYMIVEGHPAEVRAVNSIAMHRRGFDPTHIESMKEVFRRLWRDNHTAMHEKIPDIRREFRGVRSIAQLCDALEASARGVHGRALECQRLDDKRALDLEVTMGMAHKNAVGG